MALTPVQLNPNSGEATHTLPTDAKTIWFWADSITTNCKFRGSVTSTPEVNMKVDVVYGPFPVRSLAGQTIYFHSSGDTDVQLLIASGVDG